MDDAQLLRQSYDELLEAAPDLSARFYEHFFSLSAEVRELFAHVNLETQGTMLLRALKIAVEHAHERVVLEPVLQGLGYRHIDYGVKHEHYLLVKQALLETMASVLGLRFTEEHRAAWDAMLSFVTETMIQGSLDVSDMIADEQSSRGRAALLPLGDGYYMSRFSEAPRAVVQPDELLSDDLPRRIEVSFDGEKPVLAAPLQTLLQVSLDHEQGHMHECGGQAKCTTCRVLLLEGQENLMPRTEAEEKIASQRGFPPEVRLACQARLAGPVRLKRLVKDREDAISAYREGEMATARQENLAILFADIRGFTRLSSEALPYDVVHALNRYFAATCEEIDKQQGYVDKYIGDGLMALFGLAPSAEHPAQSAVRAAVGMQAAMPRLNRYLEDNMGMSFSIGVGIHFGSVVVGELGFRLKKQFSAIGDAVNVAARVEGQTKHVGEPILVTESVRQHLDPAQFSLGASSSVELAGKDESFQVYPVDCARSGSWRRSSCN